MNPRAFQVVPPLQVVTGKGGVGKSTVAAALALAAETAGRDVLAIEMGEPGGLHTLFGVEPGPHGVPKRVGRRLHITYYDGEVALAEYIGRFLPFKGVLQSVATHPLYRAFVQAGPGVRELMAIGKVRDELLGISSGELRWDLIVLDAGASGHALQLLGMPAATARTFSSGLAHREATRVAEFLADPRQTAVHVVALAEEMPLEEAASIIDRLRHDLRLPVGRLVLNQCRPPAPEGAVALLAALEGQSSTAGAALAAVARRELGWLEVQERGIAALEQRVGLRATRLPRLDEPLERSGAERLAGILATGMGL